MAGQMRPVSSQRPSWSPLILMLLSTLSAHTVNAQPRLQITSPVDGSVFEPGQSITVNVSVDPSASFTSVGIVVEDVGFGPAAIRTAPPYSFVLTLPDGVAGPKAITAFGMTAGGAGAFSTSITINIETGATLTALNVSPARLSFASAGDQIPITVDGIFADGSTLDITRSSRIAYSTHDASVATVNGTGVVTAVGHGATGTTEIVVQYGQLSATVPVSVVTRPAITVMANPATLWPPNGRLVPVRISGTVRDTGGGVNLNSARYAVTDSYGVVQLRGTVTVLPDGSYAFTISLEASRRGEDRDGRHYTIAVSAMDNFGNVGSGSDQVVVPHDQGR